MGMLRTVAIVGAAIALMPSPPRGANEVAPADGVGAFSYVAAAAETVADMRSFCQRNPNVCVTANSIALTMEGKAKYSAKLIYEWANEAAGEGPAHQIQDGYASADPVQTSSPPLAGKILAESQNTLTVADLIPTWKEPKPVHPKG